MGKPAKPRTPNGPNRSIGINEVARQQRVPVKVVRMWIDRRQLMTAGTNRVSAQSYARFIREGGVVQGELRKSPMRRGVYFVGLMEFIKIGCSIDVVQRWATQTDLPVEVSRLGFIPVPPPTDLRRVETDLHIRFAALAHRGEWFKAAPDLTRFIAEEAESWPE